MAAAEKGFTFEISNRGFCPAAAALDPVALDSVALELEAVEASFISASAMVVGGCAMAAY